MQCDFSDVDSPDPGGDQTPTLPTPGASSSPQESEPPTQTSTGSNPSDGPRDNIPCLQYVELYFPVLSFGKCSNTRNKNVICELKSSVQSHSPSFSVIHRGKNDVKSVSVRGWRREKQ